jgi:hypothetical protein
MAGAFTSPLSDAKSQTRTALQAFRRLRRLSDVSPAESPPDSGHKDIDDMPCRLNAPTDVAEHVATPARERSNIAAAARQSQQGAVLTALEEISREAKLQSNISASTDVKSSSSASPLGTTPPALSRAEQKFIALRQRVIEKQDPSCTISGNIDSSRRESEVLESMKAPSTPVAAASDARHNSGTLLGRMCTRGIHPPQVPSKVVATPRSRATSSGCDAANRQTATSVLKRPRLDSCNTNSGSKFPRARSKSPWRVLQRICPPKEQQFKAGIDACTGSVIDIADDDNDKSDDPVHLGDASRGRQFLTGLKSKAETKAMKSIWQMPRSVPQLANVAPKKRRSFDECMRSRSSSVDSRDGVDVKFQAGEVITVGAEPEHDAISASVIRPADSIEGYAFKKSVGAASGQNPGSLQEVPAPSASRFFKRLCFSGCVHKSGVSQVTETRQCPPGFGAESVRLTTAVPARCRKPRRRLSKAKAAPAHDLALVIKGKWLNLILSGRKTWEIRGTPTKVRRLVQLAQSGSGLLVGEARVTECLRLDLHDMSNHTEKHCIHDLSIVTYRSIYAWVLEDAKRHAVPKPYKHPQGAITWVKLDKPESVVGDPSVVDESMPLDCLDVADEEDRPLSQVLGVHHNRSMGYSDC